MKRFVAMIIALVLLLTISFLWEGHINRESDRLMGLLEKATLQLENGDFDACEEEMVNFLVQWERISGFWKTLVDHEHVDEVDVSYSRTLKYIQNHEKTHALAEMAVLKSNVRAIPSIFQFCIENLF